MTNGDGTVNEILEECPNGNRTFKELLLYKMDRTLAIVGLVLLGSFIVFCEGLTDIQTQVLTAVVSALGVYIGGRTAK